MRYNKNGAYAFNKDKSRNKFSNSLTVNDEEATQLKCIGLIDVIVR